MKNIYSFYLIVNITLNQQYQVLEKLPTLLSHGITCLQLRMKHIAAEQAIKIANHVLEIARSKHIPVIINDEVAIARKVDADGVHLGQSDIHYDQAREYLGATKIIGLTIENFIQAQLCHRANVDYFGVGPVYKTSTKLDAVSPMGVEELKKIASLLPKPVVAIGGITKQNIVPILQVGVAGIAVSAAVMSDDDPVFSAKNLASIIAVYHYENNKFIS